MNASSGAGVKGFASQAAYCAAKFGVVGHFLTRTLKRVGTETSLHVLAHNVKRVVAILGVRPLAAAIRA